MSYFPGTPATPGQLISTASTNAAVLKASAGILMSLFVGNQGAAFVCVKMYDKSTLPTVGTDTPKQTFLIPGSTTGAGSNLVPPTGLNFVNGIAVSITALVMVTDTTAVALNQVVLSYGII